MNVLDTFHGNFAGTFLCISCQDVTWWSQRNVTHLASLLLLSQSRLWLVNQWTVHSSVSVRLEIQTHTQCFQHHFFQLTYLITLCMLFYKVIIFQRVLTWDLKSQPHDSRFSDFPTTPPCQHSYCFHHWFDSGLLLKGFQYSCDVGGTCEPVLTILLNHYDQY